VQANYNSITDTEKVVEKLEIGHAGLESLSNLVSALPASPLRTAVAQLLKKQAKSQG
jgi:hypothetical protein